MIRSGDIDELTHMIMQMMEDEAMVSVRRTYIPGTVLQLPVCLLWGIVKF